MPDFVVSPISGTLPTTFTFDPSLTTDNLDPDNLIEVRWEFDGDPSFNSGQGLRVSYSAGADALNIATILACGARPGPPS